MKKNIIRVLKLFLVMTLICGIIYPLASTAIGQICFNDKVNGSIITVDGVNYGCEYLGQNFVEDKHLWARPVSSEKIDTTTFSDGDKRYYFAYPSNISVESEQFAKWVSERKEYITLHNPNSVGLIPSELIYQSGSGLDPHISYETAMWQLPRLVEQYDGIYTENEIKGFIDASSKKSVLNLFGKKLVNVLMVNLYLEGIIK